MSSKTERTSNTYRTVGLIMFGLVLAFVPLTGCGESGESNEKEPQKKAVLLTGTNELHIPLDSANGYLALADLDIFEPGRSRSKILKELHWRAGGVQMAECNGEAVCAIDYSLLSDDPQGGQVSLHALFVNDKFVKFIHWLPDTVEVPYEDTTWSKPRPIKFGDCHWFNQALKSTPVSIEELREEARATIAPEEQVDIGLTIAFLLTRPDLLFSKGGPSIEDLRRNAELRDQFNAARLGIGMTASEVQSTFGAKPLEEGTVDDRLYQIYGSNELVHVDHYSGLHFTNVLVVFESGKVSVVYSLCAGEGWRRGLAEEFVDLPKAHTTDPSGGSPDAPEAPSAEDNGSRR